MFRYYGIPARYVEGYLITPQDIEGKQAGDTIEIPGTNGHAWTEIYVDGLGWIPLEMTPSYYGVMEEANLKIRSGSQRKTGSFNPGDRITASSGREHPYQFQPEAGIVWNRKIPSSVLIVFDTFMFLLS